MRIALGVGILVFNFCGCASKPPEGTVSGTITLDGKPVEDGLVRFIPADGETQPNDCRIVNGAYTITMPVGEKRVEIFWLKTSGPAEDTSTQGTSKVTAMIPAKYNTESILTYTIEKGLKTNDFMLDSR